MNIGSVNNAAGIGAGLFPARLPVQPVPPVSRPAALEKEIEPAKDRLAVNYFNSQGDSVEISGEAMNLWRSLTAAGEAPSSRPALPQPALENLDLPSPFVSWAELQRYPGGDLDFKNQTPPDVSLPGVAQPDIAQPDVILPDVSLPDVALPGITPPDIAAPKSELPDSGSPDGDVSFDISPLESPGECKTCESRRYVDKSDDASVSFQTPTKVNSSMAVAAVASHENEHVRNNRRSAEREGREIVSQTVTLTYDCCPECGKSYVSGGTTRTTTIKRPEREQNNQDFANADEKAQARAR